jgi:hypothetical protein
MSPRRKFDIIERLFTASDIKSVSFNDFKFIPRRFFKPELHINYRETTNDKTSAAVPARNNYKADDV